MQTTNGYRQLLMHLLLLGFSCLYPALVPAQQFDYREFTTDDGLSSLSIFAIDQDQDGFLWFGTGAGAVRFDGARFRNYADFDGWPQNRVEDVLVDSRGNLWLGSYRDGLYLFDGEHISRYTKEHGGLISDNVRSLFEARDGSIWITYEFEAVTRFNDGKMQAFGTAQGLRCKAVHDVVQDPSGTLWLATDNGVFSYNGERFTQYLQNRTERGRWAWSLFVDSDNRIWCGTQEGALVWDGNAFTTKGLPEELVSTIGVVKDINQDTQGRFWFGTTGKGVWYYDGKLAIRLKPETGFPDVDIWSLFVDSEGNVWYGSIGNGIIQYRGNWVLKHSNRMQLLFTTIVAIDLQPDNSVLIAGVQGELLSEQGGELEPVNIAAGRFESIRDIAVGDNGHLWVATNGDGVHQFAGSRWIAHTTAQGLSSDITRQLFIDSRGNVWVTTTKDISWYDGSTWHNMSDDIIFEESNRASLITEDHHGNIWIATFRIGLFQWDGTSLTHYTTENGLPTNEVNTVQVDTRGRVWIGTTKGIVYYEDRRLVSFPGGGEVQDVNCTVILCGDQYIYFGTETNIIRWDVTQKTSTLIPHIREYPLFQMSQKASVQDPAGDLWFGTSSGAIRISPSIFDKTTIPPPVHITGLQVNYQEQAPVGNLQLAYTQNHLKIDYTSLYLSYPEWMRFRHRLTGIDEQWIENQDPVAIYSALSPGSYRFEVQSRLRDGAWSDPPLIWNFRISPPYWQTWWFRTIGLLLCGIAVVAAMQWRTRLLRIRSAQLESEVQIRTVELANQTTSLEKSQGLLSEAQDMAQIGNYELDVTTGKAYWSSTMYRICGLEPGAAIPDIKTLVVPEERALFSELLEKSGQTGAPFELEHRILLPEKGERIVHSRGKSILNADGRVAIIRGTLQDITNRRQAEDALRQSEQKLALHIEQTPLGVIEYDNQFNIVDWNPGAEHIFGFSKEEVVGRHVAGLIVPAEAREQVDLVLKALIANRGGLHSTNENNTKDGQVITCEWFNTPLIDRQGTVVGVASLVQDITERKKAEHERELLISDLEDKNAELERYTYTVSHDLKSPLVTVSGYLGLLQDDIRQGDTDQISGDIEQIQSATETMKRLLDDLLELSRIGRIVNTSDMLNLADLINKASKHFAPVIDVQKIQVTIDQDMEPAYGDRARISELILNLLANAIKFMGEQSVPRIEFGMRMDGERRVYYCRDNGMGVDPAYQEKIFGLFNQLNQKVEGSGIGLAISRRIVEVHAGRLWIESDGVGTGSAFCFTLPVSAEG
jgi:PAS domain S-box-containing protein